MITESKGIQRKRKTQDRLYYRKTINEMGEKKIIKLWKIEFGLRGEGGGWGEEKARVAKAEAVHGDETLDWSRYTSVTIFDSDPNGRPGNKRRLDKLSIGLANKRDTASSG